MAANVAPIFSKIPVADSVALTAANTNGQGAGTIGTDIFLITTAGADGAFLRMVRLIPTATTPTAMTATVIRLFLSSVSSGATTAANTHLWEERSVATQNADNTATSVIPIDIPLGFALKPGQSLLATTHAAPAANTQWKAIAIGGGY